MLLQFLQVIITIHVMIQNLKSSGIKHSYPESRSSGYYGSKHPSKHYGSSSGILSTEISGGKPQIDSAGYNSPKVIHYQK
ncbi:hypothetical protein CEXT_767721 [Caerostris extrusa]|uniref:Uncharacterized protein n=1 Tax=Caerostris extrusa TaxID=172846 RepID=A0AAV4WND8_CAEEX|nr:hypothetical protein CEXT_767721 [Caerostris extrusa]